MIISDVTSSQLKPRLIYEPGWAFEGSLSDELNLAEQAFAVNPTTDRLREAVSRTALTAYNAADSHADFVLGLSAASTPLPAGIRYVDKTRIPSPIESVLATTKNLSLACRYSASIGSYSAGVLMSGSNAWGSFYAPRLGLTGFDGPSDVDLLVEIDPASTVEEVVCKLYDDGLASAAECSRAELFTKLELQDKADLFSMRCRDSSNEVSLHLANKSVLDVISAPVFIDTDANDGTQVATPVLRDFRPNTSSNVRKHKGYILDVIDEPSHMSTCFVPVNSPVIDKNAGLVGYIAESPIGGFVHRSNHDSYMLGILPFFMAICPVIISHPGGQLDQRVRAFQTVISLVLDGRQVINLPRKNLMPSYALRAIARDLSSASESHVA